jgi:gluconokinase
MKGSPSGIALSTAMHSLIVMRDGKPITNMITWADNRAAEIARKVRKSSSGEMLYEQSGTPIHAMSPLCKILWLKENDPEVFTSAHTFISIKEYLWYKLFNVFEVDYSIASANGLMDILALEWNTNALTLCGITEQQLSTLVNTSHTRRNANASTVTAMGISPETAFVIGSSDGCMANLGSFATKPGIAALTIGTSGAIRVASESPLYNFGAMTFNYRLDEKMFICGGPSNNGGIILRWYAESFLQKKLSTQEDYHNLLSRIKTIPAGADGLIFLPYLLGERAPIWDSESCGVFFGIRKHHTQDHFTRAVVEGVSMALYDIAENMEKCGLMIDRVNVSGGFVHSTQWLKILADIFNKKICLINASDASATGAAYLCLKTLVLAEDENAFQSNAIQQIIPDADNHKVYQQQFKTYRDLYQSLQANMQNRLTND